MAIATERRGAHAFGWAFLNADGRILHYKAPGAISRHLGLLDEMEGARAVIGHCRFATVGDPANNLNNHPFACDGGFVIHNGQIPGAGILAREKGLRPVTECDSELLALLIETAAGATWRERCVWAVEQVPQGRPLVLAGLWKPGRLVLVRRGNPLFVGASARGVYFASSEGGLPRGAQPMADGTAREYPWPVGKPAGLRRFSADCS
jgi:glucosamine 6-phosphate synthetase-like amidotransferase/phosphosugar isomerase protein